MTLISNVKSNLGENCFNLKLIFNKESIAKYFKA